jgi:muconolactone delta-isomerase
MEFLVEFEISVPEGTRQADVKTREQREADATAMLADRGHLARVWRLPGPSDGTKVLGLYRAESEEELDLLLRSLPLYEWMNVTVMPLAPHPNDPAPERTPLSAGSQP